ncbi:MAG: hypothetical protein OXG13_08425 [Gemmatimonadaceae bacterium]|nr:hypothetical protein [Gemmatimonadaceae bacterium]
MRPWTGLLVAVALGIGVFVLEAPAGVDDHPILIRALELLEQPVYAQRIRLFRGEPPAGAQIVRLDVTFILAVTMLVVAAIGLPILLYLIWARGKKRT